MDHRLPRRDWWISFITVTAHEDELYVSIRICVNSTFVLTACPLQGASFSIQMPAVSQYGTSSLGYFPLSYVSSILGPSLSATPYSSYIPFHSVPIFSY